MNFFWKNFSELFGSGKMNITLPVEPTRRGIMALPPEIRIMVYKYCLLTPHPITPTVGVYRLWPNLLCTSRTIHEEASEVLYGKNHFVTEETFAYGLADRIPKRYWGCLRSISISFVKLTDEYKAYLDGKPVSEVLHEDEHFHLCSRYDSPCAVVCDRMRIYASQLQLKYLRIALPPRPRKSGGKRDLLSECRDIHDAIRGIHVRNLEIGYTTDLEVVEELAMEMHVETVTVFWADYDIESLPKTPSPRKDETWVNTWTRWEIGRAMMQAEWEGKEWKFAGGEEEWKWRLHRNSAYKIFSVGRHL